MNQEEWKPIIGFDGYQVSNLGRVQSFRKGDLFPLILKPSRANKARRALYTLYKNKKPHWRLASRLVCEAFNGPAPSGYHAAHLDGNHLNDCATNLEWKTPLANMADRDKHGRTSRGSKHYASILDENDVAEIKRIYADAKQENRVYGVVTALADVYGVKLGTIENIIYGRRWRVVA